MPVEYVGAALAPIKTGLAVWLADEARIADEQFAARVSGSIILISCADGQQLDNLYIILLSSLTGAIEAHHIQATSETLDDLIDIYAPRLSRAQSSAVPAAFKDFWQSCFQSAQLDYSDEVADFLRDVLAAVPGMIHVSGLAVPDSWSEVSMSIRLGAELMVLPGGQSCTISPQSSLSNPIGP